MGNRVIINHRQLTSALNELINWFQKHQRILPWREDPSVYRVWISEIMLQQTQVVTVIPYFERFLTLFPNVEALAKASEQSVLKAWEGLGYYSRARNLQKAAKLIVERGAGRAGMDGGFPMTREQWLEIPGVGPYTAGAICSIALGLPEAILDGNVERVVSRLTCVGRTDPDFKERWWETSRFLVGVGFRKKHSMSDLNQALMELGARVCTPTAPKCVECPVRSVCLAFCEKRVGEFPGKKPKQEFKAVSEVRHVWVNERDEVLFSMSREKSSSKVWRQGLWDFLSEKPATKLHPKLLGKFDVKYVVTNHRVKRTCQVWRVKKTLKSSPEQQWCDLENLGIPVGAPIKKSFSQISKFLAGTSKV